MKAAVREECTHRSAAEASHMACGKMTFEPVRTEGPRRKNGSTSPQVVKARMAIKMTCQARDARISQCEWASVIVDCVASKAADWLGFFVTDDPPRIVPARQVVAPPEPPQRTDPVLFPIECTLPDR